MNVPKDKLDTEQAERPHHFRTKMLGVLLVIIVWLPPALGYWLADRAGDLGLRFAGKSRRAAISNMRHVLGPVPKAVLRKNVRTVFHNVARSYYDLCRAARLPDTAIDSMIDFDEAGWQRVAYLHAQGRGVILVSGHFGAFDEITQVISRHGFPVTVLIAQIKPAWVSDFITGLRTARNLKMLLVNEEEGSGLNFTALKESLGLLRRGEILGVIADRNMEKRGESIPFFGQDAIVATGIAKMALRTKSVIIPCFGIRLPNKRYNIVFDEPIEPAGSASNDEDIRNLLIKIFSRFEYHISRNPDQWILLQHVWPSPATPQNRG